MTAVGDVSAWAYGTLSGDLTSITRPSPLGGESFTYDAAHPHSIKTATDGRGKVLAQVTLVRRGLTCLVDPFKETSVAEEGDEFLLPVQEVLVRSHHELPDE